MADASGTQEPCRARQLAQALHRQMNVSYPVNVSRLLEGLDTHRVFDVSARTFNAQLAAASGGALHPRRAWTVYHEQLDVYLIVWNEAQPVPSIRFSVAHEIGHILLNHERDRPGDAVLNKRRKEAEANAFAAHLLAPYEAVRALLGGGAFCPGAVARYFGMPHHAARRHAHGYARWHSALPGEC